MGEKKFEGKGDKEGVVPSWASPEHLASPRPSCWGPSAHHLEGSILPQSRPEDSDKQTLLLGGLTYCDNIWTEKHIFGFDKRNEISA